MRQELLAVGSKVSVSEVAKELGARWKALSEEQQAVYREQAQQLRQQVASTRCLLQDCALITLFRTPQAATEASDAPDLEAEEPPSTLPMATIRKIMLLDSEVCLKQQSPKTMGPQGPPMYKTPPPGQARAA